MEAITQYLSEMYEFVNSGVYELLTGFLAVLVEYITIAAINFKILVITIAWGTAENIMANLGLSEAINNSWSQIDSSVMGYLTFFRIPESLNIVIQAYITRFSLSVLGL